MNDTAGIDTQALLPQQVAAGQQVDKARRHSASWRQLVIICAARDRAELVATGKMSDSRATPIQELLALAEAAAGGRISMRRWWTGSSQDLAWLSLHEAEAQLTVLLSEPELVAHARDVLAKARTTPLADDDRVNRLAAALDATSPSPDPAAVMHVTRVVHRASDDRYAQSRGFRNRLIRLTLISLAALGLLMVAFATNAIPLTIGNQPDSSIVGIAAILCLFGAIGALISAVPPLANAPGTWNPFTLPLYQLLLKLVLGPVFAIVGLLLLKSGVFPNVGYPTTIESQIVWAIVFGATQQAVTRVIDQRAASLSTSSPPDTPRTPDRPGAGTSR